MDDPGFFVGLGTLSLINAGLAQSKGRSGFAVVAGFVVYRADCHPADCRPAEGAVSSLNAGHLPLTTMPTPTD